MLLGASAQPAQAGNDSVQTFGLVLGPGQTELRQPIAHLNAATSKFEGLLNAFT